MSGTHAERRRLADKAAARIVHSMSELTRPRQVRRTTMKVANMLAFEIAVVLCVGSMLFIH